MVLLLIPFGLAYTIDQYGGITWEFEHIENDTKLDTSILEINETYLELNVTEKYDLPNNYRWHMALCNLSGVDELHYMEEDAQGGFNYSYPIEVNYGYLLDYGLPSDWCHNTSGYGYVLFSSGGVRQLPLRIRLIFPSNYPMRFLIYTGDSTSVIDASAVTTATALTPQENLARDSRGIINTAYIGGGGDLWWGNFSEEEGTWNVEEIVGGFQSFANPEILVNSNDYLFIHYEARTTNPVPTIIRNSTNHGDTWSAVQYMFWAGAIGHMPPPPYGYPGADDAACTIDRNDIIHCCASWNLSHLHYINSTGWRNDTVIHQDQTDDTDYCDIAVDSNDNVCIVAFGNVQSDLDVFCNTDGWQRHHVDDLTAFLYIYGDKDAPTITVDNDDMFHIAYADPFAFTSVPQLKHANFTASDLTTFSTETVDDEKSYYYDIGVSTQKDLWILYSNHTDLRTISHGAIFSANKSYQSSTWTARTLVDTHSNIPSIQDSRYPCSNRMTDTLRYAWTNGTNYVLYENQSIYYPSCFPPCDSDWVVECSDNCISDRERDIRPYNFKTTGIGTFTTYYDIWASDFYFNVSNCHNYIYNSFLRLE
jgi:hypothetical protein